MRVIAGEFRGRSLSSPAGVNTRPITDRVKETIFNILGNRWGRPGWLPDFDVLDVFAGTGGLGIEAVSRGAARCYFIERDRRALRCLRENIKRLQLGPRGKLLAENAWTLRPPEVSGGFGLVFVDPPYRDVQDTARVRTLLERLGLVLGEAGVMIFRHEVGTDFPTAGLLGLREVDRRRMNRMQVIFLERTAGDEAAAPSGSLSAADGGVGDVAGGEHVKEEGGAENVRDDADG